MQFLGGQADGLGLWSVRQLIFGHTISPRRACFPNKLVQSFSKGGNK